MACNSADNSAENKSSLNQPNKNMASNTETKLIISSTAFADGQKIPVKYSCDGDDINPPLRVENIPAQAQTLALILEDPDAPRGTFIHWVCWNLPPAAVIDENSQPGIQGTNSADKTGYKGPCPPKGKPHHYNFKVFALDKKLDLEGSATHEELEKAMEGHIIAKGELQGLYSTD